MFDKVKKIFININDKDYSVGKKIEDLTTISSGSWKNFNLSGLKSFGLIFKDTDNCELQKKKGSENIYINRI